MDGVELWETLRKELNVEADVDIWSLHGQLEQNLKSVITTITGLQPASKELRGLKQKAEETKSVSFVMYFLSAAQTAAQLEEIEKKLKRAQEEVKNVEERRKQDAKVLEEAERLRAEKKAEKVDLEA